MCLRHVADGRRRRDRPPRVRDDHVRQRVRRGSTRAAGTTRPGSAALPGTRRPRSRSGNCASSLAQFGVRERVLLLEAQDRDVGDARSRADARRARSRPCPSRAITRRIFLSASFSTSPITFWKRPSASSVERRHGFLVPQQALRAHHDQRPPERAQHLPPQQVVDLRRRRRHAHLHVVLGAQLQVALRARRRMLGPLAFVAVRQQQHETADAAPLHFARRDELVDHHLRAVGEVAELRLPDHEAQRDRKSSSRIRSRARRTR